MLRWIILYIILYIESIHEIEFQKKEKRPFKEAEKSTCGVRCAAKTKSEHEKMKHKTKSFIFVNTRREVEKSLS